VQKPNAAAWRVTQASCPPLDGLAVASLVTKEPLGSLLDLSGWKPKLLG